MSIYGEHASFSFVDPCCQIDLYSILARAPPAEIEKAVPHDPGWDGEESGDPTISKKADKKPRQERGSLGKLASIKGRGERRAFKTVGKTPREELGGYVARDPLGEEVAELDAKAQESLRR